MGTSGEVERARGELEPAGRVQLIEWYEPQRPSLGRRLKGVLPIVALYSLALFIGLNNFFSAYGFVGSLGCTILSFYWVYRSTPDPVKDARRLAREAIAGERFVVLVTVKAEGQEPKPVHGLLWFHDGDVWFYAETARFRLSAKDISQILAPPLGYAHSTFVLPDGTRLEVESYELWVEGVRQPGAFSLGKMLRAWHAHAQET
jgi:hypothetical protein